MKFRPFALLAFIATVGLVACSEDPTEVGHGDPFAIVSTRTQITVPRNVSTSITAYTIDQNNRRIPGALTATSANTAALVLDSTIYVQELSETRFFVSGLTVSATGVDLTITGPSSLTKTATVIIE
jgi:hypothetical protein